jgi:hypothetical protein
MFIILVNEQYEFTINISTQAASYNVIKELSKAINNRLTVGGMLCELEKVFDCVNCGNVVNKQQLHIS